MICPICRNGQTQPGFASVTLERAGTTVLVQHVPALVCNNCGEEFVDECASRNLLLSAEDAVKNGVQVEVRRYAVA